MFSTVFRIQWLRTSLSALAEPISSPSQTSFRENAGNACSQRVRASGVPAAMTTSAPCSAGCRVPSTGASTKSSPRAEPSSASRRVHSSPTVLICAQTAPAPTSAERARITSSTACPSASIVTTSSASRTASPGVSATVPPSPSAFSRVRFQARTSCPASASRRAIGAPMIPVPRTAIRTLGNLAQGASRPERCNCLDSATEGSRQ